ncbi:MAG: nucleotidyltransferase domain-containing protein [Candidatus Thermoplasmatota archaeon]|nr:nucleotidyltransferase domain-containing protein [Candidatus Thermoplasmatota archaeon]
MISKSIQPLLGEIIFRLPQIPKLTAAILYGSAARGEITEASDIDLMLIFDVPHNPETGGELEKAHKILGKIETKRKIQLVAYNLKQALDPDFLDNVAREGVVIHGKPLVITAEKLRLSPYIIFTYSVAGVAQLKKSGFQRALRGYKTIKKVKGKLYKSESLGALKLLSARKLGKGSVIVPQEKAKEFEELLKRYKLKYSKIKAWC